MHRCITHGAPLRATTSCKNVGTLPRKHDLFCFKSFLVIGLWDIILTSLLPPIQSCSSKFWVWSCIASNFDKGWRGDHKDKIMDRPFMPKYGTVSQVLLQLVVACESFTINWCLIKIQTSGVSLQLWRIKIVCRRTSVNSDLYLAFTEWHFRNHHLKHELLSNLRQTLHSFQHFIFPERSKRPYTLRQTFVDRLHFPLDWGHKATEEFSTS